MEFEEALKLTQNRLSEEDGDIGNLLSLAKGWTPEALIGNDEWESILTRAKNLPISMGAFPFGFEFPLHTSNPTADFGVSLTGGTKTGNIFCERVQSGNNNELDEAIVKLFRIMDGDDPTLRSIVGRKLMLEFDVGSPNNGISDLPGFFLRPGQKPINGGEGKTTDVFTVSESLYSSVGWTLNQTEKEILERVYSTQQDNTRLDSFGIFPSRLRGLRLAVMGFNSPTEAESYLQEINWPGDTTSVKQVWNSLQKRAQIVRNGVNLDIREEGLGHDLGLTAMVKQRYTNDRRYWLDDSTLWHPFMDALGAMDIVVEEKLSALKGWMEKPKLFYGKAGRFVILRGIHHVKLVISDNQISKVKAYVFMFLTALD